MSSQRPPLQSARSGAQDAVPRGNLASGDGSAATVADLASRFAGPSKPTPEQEMHTLAAIRDRQRLASQDSQASQHAYRNRGNDFMSEFERLRRLEAIARARAEEEARRNLHAYDGSLALILALERLRLGLPLTPDERRLVDEHSQKTQVHITYSADDIQRAQDQALEAAFQQEQQLLQQYTGPRGHGAPSVAHSVSVSQPTVIVHDTPSARTASLSSVALTPFVHDAVHAPSASRASSVVSTIAPSDDAVVAQQLLEAIRDMIIRAQRPVQLAEVYDMLAERAGQDWGTAFEGRFGSLYSFVRDQGPRAGLAVHGGLVSLAHPSQVGLMAVESTPPFSDVTYAYPPGPASFVSSVSAHSQPQAFPLPPPYGAHPPVAWPPQHAYAVSLASMHTAVSQPMTPLDPALVGAAQPPGGASSQNASSAAPVPAFDPFAAVNNTSAQTHMTAAGRGYVHLAAPASAATDAMDLLGIDRLASSAPPAAASHTIATVQAPQVTHAATASSLSVQTTQVDQTFAGRQPTQPQARRSHETGTRRTTRQSLGVETVAILDVTASANRRQSAPRMPEQRAVATAGAAPQYGPARTDMQVVTREMDRVPAAAMSRPLASPPARRGRALDVEEMAQRIVSRGLCERDAELTWHDFDILFRPILTHGFWLIKHGRHGPAKKRRFWMTHALDKLYWDTGKILDVLMTGERHLDMIDVIDLSEGAGTDVLRRKMLRGELPADSDLGGSLTDGRGRLFSLITRHRSLDLEAMSSAQARVLVRAFAFLVRRVARRRTGQSVWRE